MPATGLEIFDRTLQTTNIWLDEIMDEIGQDRHAAWHVLSAVLRTLRDRLTVDESAHLSAQLPLLVRGLYYDQWQPSHVPTKWRTREEFIEHVAKGLKDIRPVDQQIAVQAVFDVLARHISKGQFDEIAKVLPEKIRGFFEQASAHATTATSEYVQKAAIRDLFEIRSGELALEQAESADVKAFAQRMISHHTTTSEALKASIHSANLRMQVPEKIDRALEARLNALRKLKGREFDADYMSEQIDAHRDALKLHQSYAEKGDDPALKKTAAKTKSIIEHHLQAAQEIVKKMPRQSSSSGSSHQS